ncbi:c-type cytochrome [Profundibacter amoris]|uniref:Cytochrome C n=1 Tax=Profundibacter amoris TaxID=2171755 RepID=A0A347UJA8_9RHOB|nr:c-type cytochrome [Profundibacter amoris]AXX98936.1 cytochrome C [Profundibacter amoris]
MKRTLAILAVLAAASPAFAEGDVAAGEKLFKKCKACHMIVNGDDVIFKGGKTGPNLYGVIGRAAGSQEDFTKYSAGLVALGEAGLVWDEENFTAWVTNPKEFLKAHDQPAKTGMSFKLKRGGEDVAAYLASLAPAPEATEGEASN